MKALKVLPVVMLLGAAGPAFAQTLPAVPGTPAPQAVNSLSWEVRSVANGGGGDAKSTGGGNTISQTRTRSSQTTIELKVRNLARTPVSAEFEYYFVANAVSGSKYISSKGSKPITIAPGQEQRELFQSAEIAQSSFQSTTTDRVSSSETLVTLRRSKTGASHVGWFVRLMSEGKVIRVVASSAEYEKVGRDQTLLAALLRGGSQPRQ